MLDQAASFTGTTLTGSQPRSYTQRRPTMNSSPVFPIGVPQRRFQNRAGSPDRAKRFEATRNATLVLQPNDQEVINLVDRCRFVDSRQLRLTVGRGLNERAFLRRLRQLFDAEFLDRPEQQLNRWWTKGEATKHYVYALGIEGHRLL